MSACADLQPLLALVADGDATADELWRVRAHVGCCSACRIQLARERLLSVVLHDWRTEEPAAKGVSAETRGGTRRVRDRRGLRLAVFAGLGFATAGLGALSYARPASPWHAAVALPRWGEGIQPLLGAESLLRLAWSSLHVALGGGGVEAAQVASFAASLVRSGLLGVLLLALAGCGILAATWYRGSRRAV